MSDLARLQIEIRPPHSRVESLYVGLPYIAHAHIYNGRVILCNVAVIASSYHTCANALWVVLLNKL